jgi:hypothetical protein
MTVSWDVVAFALLQTAVTSGAATAVFRGGMAMRDAVRDLGKFTIQLRVEVNDHEDRLRVIEGRPERRFHERRQAADSI